MQNLNSCNATFFCFISRPHLPGSGEAGVDGGGGPTPPTAPELCDTSSHPAKSICNVNKDQLIRDRAPKTTTWMETKSIWLSVNVHLGSLSLSFCIIRSSVSLFLLYLVVPVVPALFLSITIPSFCVSTSSIFGVFMFSIELALLEIHLTFLVSLSLS